MRKSPMMTRVNGPTTTTRRLVMAPAKSAPPQRLAQPIPTRTAARAAIEHAGRYTRDDRATRPPLASRLLRSAGARSGAAAAGTGVGERRGAGAEARARPGAAITDITTSKSLTRALAPSASSAAARRTGAGTRTRARAGRLGCHHREPLAPGVRQVVAG